MGDTGESWPRRPQADGSPGPVKATPESLGFALCEALSWAVAGELMLTSQELMAPLYPDTMPLYDNLWLRTDSGRNVATMNRMGGHLPGGRNLWALASQDPQMAADALRNQGDLPVGPGWPDQATLAFRVAQWLLEGLPLREGANRGLVCWGNLEGQFPGQEVQRVPEDWLSEERFWLHWMLTDFQPVGILNFRLGAYQRLSHPHLPETVLRPDGKPGCPLAFRLLLDAPGLPGGRSKASGQSMASVSQARRQARIYHQEGWNVTLEPLFSLAEGEIFINSAPYTSSN